jgi:hypothetical protein
MDRTLPLPDHNSFVGEKTKVEFKRVREFTLVLKRKREREREREMVIKRRAFGVGVV